ncbi:MAG: FeS-binding protein, partial [Bacteroidota bacterium]
MKIIKSAGLGLFLIGILIFTFSIFIGGYQVSGEQFASFYESRGFKSELFKTGMEQNVVDKAFGSSFAASSAIISSLNAANDQHKAAQEWDQVIWDKPHSLAFSILKPAGTGFIVENKGLFFFLTFGLAMIGGLMYILPNVILLGGPGIKNNHTYQQNSTSRGWIAYLTFGWLIVFYILLYFFPDYIISWVYPVDPFSVALSGNLASQWFLYGTMYTSVMLVMGVKMYVKYRHNMYQIVRTTS